jgi:hypothetical protein
LVGFTYINDARSNTNHVELILEINKTVIVASSWSSIFTLPTLMMHGQTQMSLKNYVGYDKLLLLERCCLLGLFDKATAWGQRLTASNVSSIIHSKT